MALYWKNISPGLKPPELMNTIIECPKKTQVKYEMSKTTNLIKMDRVLHSSVIYPQDYGFIPGTMAPDGDALDILVMISNPTVPGTIIVSRPVGVLIMEDEKGIDEKILSVAVHDPFYDVFHRLDDIQRHILDEISEFFRSYKNLEEPKYAHVKEWQDRERAFDIIKRSITEFKAEFGDIATIVP